MLLNATLDESDQLWLEQLHNNYFRLMLSEAYKYVSGPDQAQDIVQQAWLQILERIELVRKVDKKAIPAYLAMTVRHCAVDNIRLNQSKGHIPFAELSEGTIENISTEESFEDILMEKYDNTMLVEAIEQLSPLHHYLLMAKYFLELSDQAIAQHIAIKPDSVRVYLMRARRKLLEIYKENSNG